MRAGVKGFCPNPFHLSHVHGDAIATALLRPIHGFISSLQQVLPTMRAGLKRDHAKAGADQVIGIVGCDAKLADAGAQLLCHLSGRIERGVWQQQQKLVAAQPDGVIRAGYRSNTMATRRSTWSPKS